MSSPWPGMTWRVFVCKLETSRTYSADGFSSKFYESDIHQVTFYGVTRHAYHAKTGTSALLASLIKMELGSSAFLKEHSVRTSEGVRATKKVGAEDTRMKQYYIGGSSIKTTARFAGDLSLPIQLLKAQ